jgi:hypothetical protein
MGGALKSIGNAVVGGLKDIGKTVLQSVGGPAIDLLKKTVGSGFDGILGAAKGLVSQIPIAGPLLSGLMDKLGGGLKDKILNGGESFLKDMISKYTGVKLETGTTVSPASVGTPERATAAAAATTAATTAASNAPAQLSGNSDIASITADLAAKAKAAGLDPNDPDVKKQLGMQAMQKQMQQQNELMQMMSNIQQAQHDTKKGIIQNFRV